MVTLVETDRLESNSVPATSACVERLETFVPLYITNRCDAVCAVCSMRRGNTELVRIDVDIKAGTRQLEVIRRVEGISSVCFLTGEYVSGDQRASTIAAVAMLVGRAFDLDFEKVYINIGALSEREVGLFGQRFPSEGRLVLSLFQETYDRRTYARFFGKVKASNPKSDFDFRLTTPDRWLAAGFVEVDVGILVGLGPLASDLAALEQHASFLRSRGATVALSLPRLRGDFPLPFPVDDEEYADAVRHAAAACPWAKVILTTRESLDFIRRLLPYVGIVAPGTSDVMPYSDSGPIPNRRETSQFVVAGVRPRPSWVLDALGLPEGAIRYYRPVRGGNQ